MLFESICKNNKELSFIYFVIPSNQLNHDSILMRFEEIKLNKLLRIFLYKSNKLIYIHQNWTEQDISNNKDFFNKTRKPCLLILTLNDLFIIMSNAIKFNTNLLKLSPFSMFNIKDQLNEKSSIIYKSYMSEFILKNILFIGKNDRDDKNDLENKSVHYHNFIFRPKSINLYSNNEKSNSMYFAKPYINNNISNVDFPRFYINVHPNVFCFMTIDEIYKYNPLIKKLTSNTAKRKQLETKEIVSSLF